MNLVVPTISVQSYCGFAAGVLSVGAIGVYLVDIVRGGTRPSKVTWWVLALLNGALAASYFATGARETVWLPASYAFGFLIVAGFSVRHGEGTWLPLDWLCFGGALIGVAAWELLRSPTIALALLVLVDLLGMAPTFVKAWRRPWTESRAAWIAGTAASLINVLAITQWSVEVAAYPLYALGVNGLVMGLILRRRIDVTAPIL